jgi:hypothetical protein
VLKKSSQKTFKPKKNEVTEQFRPVRNEEAYELSRLPNAVRKVKSRRLLWPGYVE